MYSSEGYQALRERSAVVRRGDRGVLEVAGVDRLTWLQGLLTNDVATLEPGQSRYSAYLTPQGRMITDLRVVNLSDRTFLEVPAVLAESLRAKLDALLFAEDARLSDVSTSLAVVDLLGPDAPAILARLRATPASSAINAVIHDDTYELPASTLLVTAPDTARVVKELTIAGALETTLETLDVVRVESGVPLFLVDMDEHTIPLEAGIEQRAISFTKGCYVGQEVIVRVTQRGQGRVAKKLVGLMLARDSSAHAKDAVYADEREVGRLTSVVVSPALQRPIALGYVHRDFVQPGTPLTVVTAAGRSSATVAALPFVTSPRAVPQS
jgi:folate-binding protein YgfZ